MHERGHYIVLEGDDGAGKSTQVNRLESRMINAGRRVLRFEEPGGTEYAELMRDAVKNGNVPRHPLAEAMTFQTARIDTWYLKGEAALEAGIDLLASRSYESTKIYQGRAGGVSVELIDQINRLTMPTHYIHPSKFILLMILDDAVRKERLANRPKPEIPDAIESRDPEYGKRVRQGYLELAQKHGVEIVDASGTEDEVEDLVWQKIKPLFEERPKSR